MTDQTWFVSLQSHSFLLSLYELEEWREAIYKLTTGSKFKAFDQAEHKESN